jgi:SWI/SNF-related matrix-associated actin-dependent regulator 1 of chromatin subfamily A
MSEPVTPNASNSTPLDPTASLFSQILRETPDAGVDAAFTLACRLAEGLFSHQIDGVAFLLGRRRAILADDMGLGKTRQAIVSLRHATPDGPCLVICPASLKQNWAREIRVVEPDADVAIVPAAAAQAGAVRWTVVNYDVLRVHAKALMAVPWSGIVVDEAHYIKNHTSARSRLVRDIAQAAMGQGGGSNGPAIYALTGTPLTNRPRDLFTLLQLVGHPLGRSFLSFAKRYCAAYRNEYGWVTDGASNLEELTLELHGVMLRRTKAQVLSLPPKLRAWLAVEVPAGIGSTELGRAVRLLLDQRTSRAVGDDEAHPAPRGQGRVRTQLLASLTKARQQLAVGKADATKTFVDDAVEQGEKVIVFSCFDQPLRTLGKHFGERAVTLTGSTPSARRQALVDRFQQDDTVRVFLANIVAGGIGLNLTAARQVVFNDLDWVPANHWQAEDRAYRIGQTGTVNVTYIVAPETMDDFVRAVLETKATLVDAVVEGQAVADEALGNVLDELERALEALSPRLADTSPHDLDDEQVRQLVRELADERRGQSGDRDTHRSTHALDPAVTRQALLALARALRGPAATRYRVASSSKAGAYYELVVGDGQDVECSCPGFDYRGSCRHSRELKQALARGEGAPAAFEAVE